MSKFFSALILTATLGITAQAQQYASTNGYRICAPSATQQGIQVASAHCGTVKAPDFSNLWIESSDQLQSLQTTRDTFRSEVTVYGQCITQLINSYRRPGAPADSQVPDQAACAHSWAQDQTTKVIREFGQACIDYSDRSVMDAEMETYTGACYPSAGNGRG